MRAIEITIGRPMPLPLLAKPVRAGFPSFAYFSQFGGDKVYKSFAENAINYDNPTVEGRGEPKSLAIVLSEPKERVRVYPRIYWTRTSPTESGSTPSERIIHSRPPSC